MSQTALEESCATPTIAARVADKVWREVSRPFRRRMQSLQPEGVDLPVQAAALAESAPGVAAEESLEPVKQYLTGSGASFAGFHPQQATIEAECVPFIQQLVQESRQYGGPIVEIGTLLGITTTNMALVKAPHQKIVTVDNYCWNPWGLTPDVHEALTSQVLYYLERTGHVERIRMDKNEFYCAYRGHPPAMVFLDAWHDYEETKKDIQWAKAMGTQIIAGHDYCDEFPGVKQIVDEFGGPRKLAATAWVL